MEDGFVRSGSTLVSGSGVVLGNFASEAALGGPGLQGVDAGLGFGSVVSTSALVTGVALGNLASEAALCGPGLQGVDAGLGDELGHGIISTLDLGSGSPHVGTLALAGSLV